MPITIYHNPRCSKSRATLNLLRDNGVEPNIVEYMDNPPTAEEFEEILLQLGATPREVIRKNEKIYKQLELGDEALPDSALILAMVEHPELIERPIVVNGEKAVIGRPPENALEIL